MDFYKKVAAVCSKIPCGSAATYGQIALLCGKPHNSRQVGYGLNHKYNGTNIPAHRIINHQGYMTGALADKQYLIVGYCKKLLTFASGSDIITLAL